MDQTGVPGRSLPGTSPRRLRVGASPTRHFIGPTMPWMETLPWSLDGRLWCVDCVGEADREGAGTVGIAWITRMTLLGEQIGRGGVDRAVAGLGRRFRKDGAVLSMDNRSWGRPSMESKSGVGWRRRPSMDSRA